MTTYIPALFSDVPLLWKIDRVIPTSLCSALVSEINAANPGPVSASPGFRDQDRLIRDDRALASELFALFEPHLPKRIGSLALLGLNERLRLYRYRPGQRFSPHMDHWYQPDPTTTSLLTLLIYLNDDFEGGETRFMEQMEELIVPAAGSAIVFQHKVRHEGREVLKGNKYALRTDVMYKASSPIVTRL